MFKNIKSLILFCLLMSGCGCYAQTINVAAAQMLIKQQSFDEFASDIKRLAKQAKDQGAEIIVFPEDNSVNLIDDLPWNKQSIIKLSEYYSQTKSFIANLAKEYSMIVIGGTIAKNDNGKISNTVLIGLPDGQIIENDKIYLTPEERSIGYNKFGKNILVLDYKGTKIAILICYTSEFPNISLELAKIKPDIIIVPSYTNDLYGLNRVHNAVKMLSIQNFAYGVIVGMASGFDKQNTQGIDGVSQILFTSPQNKAFALNHLSRGNFNKEDVVVENLDITKLHQARKNYDAFPNEDIKYSKNLTIKSISI
ncbi:carbon-nitrogen hydrolase [Francisella tularensis subsp. novicida]|uniref:nitrilase-related carbon-nitrogen hydrolase n=1 Tax=Francisella tularensis TaxID=263 RepID=UPI000505B4B4|nr:nitrilase-related carbon-nitrogen hydrolase [Francisella tularensis]AJJ47835.1 carbon-nitrogen hydrolase family protein [Francisella tularensis subsp. novicida]KFJ66758.1 carbon-nitrogen hydrolase family protein [Francisella tularensis subsp. novicida]MBK2344402.1 carbon-nitrogen hydrolase [Francisella tularensis subsp. novicida]MBK2349562.1 carbon-nitrogen hydrolase [Francisella tularensis subsp. novicida]MBK2353122.1 carbon-nitrogen hydrolase [Francisella tularensis subsp. novicida]